MFGNKERVFEFGRKEVLSPADALRKLYDTDDEVAVTLDRFVKKRAEILVYSDRPTVDRDVLQQSEAEVMRTLSEHGIEITPATLEEFLATL